MVGIPKPNHKRRAPKQSKRNEFSPEVRQQVYDRDEGICRNCGDAGYQVHHVKFKSQGGRGVLANGLLVCAHCHERIHKHKILANKWAFIFEQDYGSDYYKDEWD